MIKTLILYTVTTGLLMSFVALSALIFVSSLHTIVLSADYNLLWSITVDTGNQENPGLCWSTQYTWQWLIISAACHLVYLTQFRLILAAVYLNALLATLNHRDWMQTEMFPMTGIISIPLGTGISRGRKETSVVIFKSLDTGTSAQSSTATNKQGEA